jgi:hypothetical protein
MNAANDQHMQPCVIGPHIAPQMVRPWTERACISTSWAASHSGVFTFGNLETKSTQALDGIAQTAIENIATKSAKIQVKRIRLL